MDTYLSHLRTYFRNLVLNAVGVDRDIYELLQDRDVDQAVSLMQDRDEEVDKAVAEYNVQTHRVMFRPNKRRRDSPDYVTEKLPRNRQQYINEVELFFLLGNPIIWTKDEGDDDAYKLFTDFLTECHFDARMRQAKRLAGAETESAKLYRVYREDDKIRCDVVVLARTTGYRLRPLFDQYGKMVAFACGYSIKKPGDTETHWDFYTKDAIFYCKRTGMGWNVETYRNILGKIPVVYYKQLKAWDGAVARIEREEMLDSKNGDDNNYFSDPIAVATADVIDSMTDISKPGKLIQLSGTNSHFSYVNPPQASASRVAEKEALNDSILFDTFTPDLSFEKMRGLGGVSGVAIKNAMILGYIKRDNRREIYEEMVARERNLAIEVLCLQHPEMEKKLRELKLSFQFAEPFASDERERMASLAQLYSAGVVSLDEVVHQLAICDHPDVEIQRIKDEKDDQQRRQMNLQMEAEEKKAKMQQAGQDMNPATANKLE